MKATHKINDLISIKDELVKKRAISQGVKKKNKLENYESKHQRKKFRTVFQSKKCTVNRY